MAAVISGEIMPVIVFDETLAAVILGETMPTVSCSVPQGSPVDQEITPCHHAGSIVIVCAPMLPF